jgi:Flp pilus assembly protein CpaB
MIGFAVLFGLLAVFIAQAWLNSQEEMRMRNLAAQKKPMTTKTIVVAAKPLRYGMEDHRRCQQGVAVRRRARLFFVA